MDPNRDTYQLIEDYLSGQLSPEDKARFEQRLASDPMLAQDLELHKSLYDYIGDKDEKAFRENLAKLKTKVDRKPTWSNWKKYSWLIIIPLIIAGYFLGRQLKSIESNLQEENIPSLDTTLQQKTISADSLGQNETQIEEQRDSVKIDPPQNNKSTPPPANRDDKIKIIKEIVPEEQPQVFAEVLFEPNPALEIMINGGLRSLQKSVTPVITQDNIPFERKAQVNFHVALDIETTRTHVAEDFVLKIYSNSERAYQNALPKFSFKPILDKTNNGYRMIVNKDITLQPGLYYYLFEFSSSEDLIYINKFEYR